MPLYCNRICLVKQITKKTTVILLCLLCIIFKYNLSFGQQTVSGKIVNNKTKEPLAFVNIIFNKNIHYGTSTDINGKFHYRCTERIKTLTCTYVGFEKQVLNLDSIGGNRNNLTIEMVPSEYQLKEIEIIASENPANRIIRKVIENRDINNPEKISTYKCISYNKVIYDFEPNVPDDSSSIKTSFKKLLKGGHLLIMESVTERKYIKPGKTEEKILGTKVSGFKHPTFAPLATDLQPFSFYNNLIPILDINYLNPISNGSLRKYHFRIEDTIYYNLDTTYILSFKPLPGKNIEGLFGLLYINTNKYAIQNVIAEPFEKGFIDIKIQQQYKFVDNKQWFPSQLNFEMIIKEYPSKQIGMSAKGKTFITNVELNTDFKYSDFSIESVWLDELANKRDSIFWKNHRVNSLNKREKTTYIVIDSLGEELKFDNLLKLFEKLVIGIIPISYVDLDISKLLMFNNYEGYRLGLGIYTNEKLFNYLRMGGYFGYGLKDYELKYGGEINLTINKYREIEIGLKHQNDLIGIGLAGLKYHLKTSYDLRDYIASKMNKIIQNSFSISFRSFKYAKFKISLNQTEVNPMFDYKYQEPNGQTIKNFSYSDFTINLRYAYKEKLITSLNQRVSMGTKYPIIYLCYTKGIKGLFNGELDFNRVEFRIDKTIISKNIGETKFRINGGYIDKPIPYSLLFTGDGSYYSNFPFLIRNTFQTATIYEFLSDRFINFHFSHNFKSLLLKYKKFKPHISIYQNMGIGWLLSPTNHQQIEFKTKEKGLYESGIQIDNIVKLNYLNIAYIGFGIGGYYRYGPYSYNNAQNNLAIKFSMSFTTK